MDSEVENNRNGIKRKKSLVLDWDLLKPTPSCDDDLEIRAKSDREIAESIARVKRNLQLIGFRLSDGGAKYKSILQKHEHELERRSKLQSVKAYTGVNETLRGFADTDDGVLHVKRKSSSKFTELFRKKMSEEAQKVSSQSDIICVQGYKVKQSIAPILESILKKHGDIAADCVFKTASMRSSFLETVCEVVSRIQTNGDIANIEETEQQVLATEAANINVSWLRAHLDVIRNNKKCSLLMEMKVNTGLVKKAAQMDLRERCVELMDATKRFEEAERCVRVLHLVEKNLNDNILESKGSIDSLARQPVI